MKTKTKDITDEQKAEYVELVRDGYDVAHAANLLGFTGMAFKRLRNGGFWHDPAFADQVSAALNDPARPGNIRERLDQAYWAKVEEGHWPAIEKGLYAYHPDFEPLRHTNLRVSGQIEHMARIVRELPHMTTDQIREALDAYEEEERRAPLLLEAPKDDAEAA